MSLNKLLRASLLAMLAFLPTKLWAANYVWWFKDSTEPSQVVRNKSGDIDPKSFTPSYVETPIFCFDIDTMHFLDCPYTYEIVGIDQFTDPEVVFDPPPLNHTDSYGGHEHNPDTHPYYWVAQPTDPDFYPHEVIHVTGGIYKRSSPASTFIEGRTQAEYVRLTFIAPEAAGAVWVSILLGPPPPAGYWGCPGGCYNGDYYKFHDTHLIEYPGLQPLANSGTDYFILRKPDVGHPDAVADWGLPDTISTLQLIAQKYHTLTSWRLSINDMSLPKGGLFDIHHDWTNPHKSHRDGTAFDVNQRDESGISVRCLQQVDLQKVVRKIDKLPPIQSITAKSTPVGILCEPGGRIHINVHSP